MSATATGLQAFLDGPHAAARDRVREWLSQEGNAPVPDLPLEEHRAQVLAWARELAGRGETVAGYPREYGGQDDLGGYISGFETLGFGDLSLLVKVGVQFGLFGGAVLHLGTERHHERCLADIASLELPGCFAMTEDGHGSDAQRLRTTATFLPESREFVVETPDDDAHKMWIGNAARDGRVLDGVRIEVCGPKLGLDGVDNGKLWFDGVRVPREALLTAPRTSR